MLKVITWNCNMAFRKKVQFVESFHPDILIVPECEHPDKLKFELRDTQPHDFFWYGKNVNKGLGVFSFTDFKIELMPFHNEDFKIILPLKISNSSQNYTVLAIWANNPLDINFPYIGQIWKALSFYRDKLEYKNTLLIGDFNSNTIWDKPRRVFNHSTVVEILNQKGIESAYHRYFDSKQGDENHPTFYLYRHEHKPYHLDYCFASSDLMARLKKVEIGAYTDWIKASDHMPLFIEFDT